MKKLLTALLLIIFVVSFVGCNEAQPSNNTTPTPNQTPTPPATQQQGEITPTPYLVADPTPEAVEPKQMYVTGSLVNVRSEANTTSSVLTALKRNTPVTVYRQENGWYYIEYAENKFGYMSAQYLSDEKHIATAEEQLELMSEFDFSEPYCWTELPDNDDASYVFAVTDLNQNGRLELFIVSSYIEETTKTYVELFEVDENYASLKEHNNIEGYRFDYSEANKSVNYWPDILTSFNSVYIKDNKYYYLFGTGGKNPSVGEYHLVSLDGYQPTSKELVFFREGDNEFEYFDSDFNKLTYEEYQDILKSPLKDATRKTYSIKWEYYLHCGTNKTPLYDYSKATSEQRLIALKKSYEGFIIK